MAVQALGLLGVLVMLRVGLWEIAACYGSASGWARRWLSASDGSRIWLPTRWLTWCRVPRGALMFLGGQPAWGAALLAVMRTASGVSSLYERGILSRRRSIQAVSYW